ncbi:MAG TPA: hypothetical protein VHO06_20120, partial [Polyangia bacterium]|nr:hypothetical protein [Polyangia bacterium]
MAMHEPLLQVWTVLILFVLSQDGSPHVVPSCTGVEYPPTHELHKSFGLSQHMPDVAVDDVFTHTLDTHCPSSAQPAPFGRVPTEPAAPAAPAPAVPVAPACPAAPVVPPPDTPAIPPAPVVPPPPAIPVAPAAP